VDDDSPDPAFELASAAVCARALQRPRETLLHGVVRGRLVADDRERDAQEALVACAVGRFELARRPHDPTIAAAPALSSRAPAAGRRAAGPGGSRAPRSGC